LSAVAPAAAVTTPGAPPAATGPFSRFEWMVAGRYLRARRKDTFISVIAFLTLAGVAIGVMTLIVVMSVMNGFRAELLDKIIGLNGHFTAYPIERQFTDYDKVAAEVELVPGVSHAVAYVEGQALASGVSGDSTGVYVRGMDIAAIQELPLLYQGNELGGWDEWDTAGGIAVGTRLAQKLGVTIGDKVTIVNLGGAMTPFGTAPQYRSFDVNVIFDLGMVEFDSFYLFMPMSSAQSYFKMYESALKPGAQIPGVMATDEEIDAAYERIPQATALDIFVDNPDAIESMRNSIQNGISRPLILTDWQQRNETLFSALQVERVVMFVILSMIVLVAAFNINSSLIMLVKDKGKDIAILRTMGATRGSIMRIFSITGTTIGVARLPLGVDRRTDLPAGSLLPFGAAEPDQCERSDGRRRPVARPVGPCDALSGVARCAL
jgi:lipoprotein-releasing system permease protein